MNLKEFAIQAYDAKHAKSIGLQLAEASNADVTVIRYSDKLPAGLPEFEAFGCNKAAPNRPYNVIYVCHPNGTVSS